MSRYYRDPLVEEGASNLVFQNRCGNRLTVQFHERAVFLEIAYKPNALRRADFGARNFSNREIYTPLFNGLELPEIRHAHVKKFEYSPFITRLQTQNYDTQSKNTITLLNLPGANAFGISARRPLLLSIKPRETFEFSGGLLFESFTDRGEGIVSFVAFPGIETNRYRTSYDGNHILQLMEEDVILFGAEEDLQKIQAVIDTYGRRTLNDLESKIELELEPALASPIILSPFKNLQKLTHINKELLHSVFDAAGSTSNALNRAGDMPGVAQASIAAASAGHAGMQAIPGVWAPFLTRNPSKVENVNGEDIPRFGDLPGTRWSNPDDNGLFFAWLSLFSMAQTCGDFPRESLPALLGALDEQVETRLEESTGLFVSRQQGRALSADATHIGFDLTSGKMEHMEDDPYKYKNVGIWQAFSLFDNVNQFNLLKMAGILLTEVGREPERAARYGELAGQLGQKIVEAFLDDGIYQSKILVLEEGSRIALGSKEIEQWKYAWAVAGAPFLPDLAGSASSARFALEQWAYPGGFEYTALNMLVRFLSIFDMDDEQFKKALADEMSEALMVTSKYPMAGLITEKQFQANGNRGLPMASATFLDCVTSRLLCILPQGLALGASSLLEGVEKYKYRQHIITLTANGIGTTVADWTLNGNSMHTSLQVPETWLISGENFIQVERGEAPRFARLAWSDARLLQIDSDDTQVIFTFASAMPSRLLFEGVQTGTVFYIEDDEVTPKEIEGTGRWLISPSRTGEFKLYVQHGL